LSSAKVIILDLLNTGEVDDKSLSEFIEGLRETDKVTKGLYYISYLILLPIAAIPVLKKKTHWKRGFIVRICCRKRFWFFNNWVNRTLKLDKLRRIHNVSFKHGFQDLCVSNFTSWDFKPVAVKYYKVCVFAFGNITCFIFAVHGPCSVNR